MFGSSKRPKEEPEKPYRYEPDRPEVPEYQPLQPARFMAGMPNLAGHLAALNGINRPMLPPTDLARRHLPELADVIKEVGDADAAAFYAAREWMSAQAGEGFKDALTADAEWVRPWLEEGERPPSDDGPLFTHMTKGIPEAFAEAFHAQVAADLADRRARQFGASDAVRKPLDEMTDDFALQIQGRLERARDHKDRRAYDDALDICGTWSEASALWEWSANTSKAFRNRSPHSAPRHLAVLEFEAATEIGLNPSVVPVEVLEDPAAPPSKLFPAARPRAPFQVIGEEPKWGPDGPPGSRRGS